MIVVGGKPIGVPSPSSPGVSYTLWRMKLESLGIPTSAVSGIISKVAAYAEAPKTTFYIEFKDFDELYAAAAVGLFAKTLSDPLAQQTSVPMVVMTTPSSSLPARTSVQHVVLALIDHPIVVYKDQPLRSESVARAVLQDEQVSVETRALASAQWGERNQAEDFFDDVVPGNDKRCIVVDDYRPNTPEQLDKIRTALANIAVTGTLFILGHCDAESRRLAGLTGGDLAGSCDAALAGARSVVLWGCHTAGQAASTQEAALLGGASVMSVFHAALTASRQVQGFTCYVNTGGMNGARLRYNDSGAYTDATWQSVDHRFTSTLGHSCKHLAAS